MSNSLDPDHAWQAVGPDLGPNVDTSRQRVKTPRFFHADSKIRLRYVMADVSLCWCHVSSLGTGQFVGVMCLHWAQVNLLVSCVFIGHRSICWCHVSSFGQVNLLVSCVFIWHRSICWCHVSSLGTGQFVGVMCLHLAQVNLLVPCAFIGHRSICWCHVSSFGTGQFVGVMCLPWAQVNLLVSCVFIGHRLIGWFPV